jgi:hypothetical protein
MKIRLPGNNTRFPLKQTEVPGFLQEGEIAEVSAFDVQTFEKLSFIFKQAASDEFKINYERNTIPLEASNALCTV